MHQSKNGQEFGNSLLLQHLNRSGYTVYLRLNGLILASLAGRYSRCFRKNSLIFK
jgi:hypothetical protein